jgi:hypothetical protein
VVEREWHGKAGSTCGRADLVVRSLGIDGENDREDSEPNSERRQMVSLLDVDFSRFLRKETTSLLELLYVHLSMGTYQVKTKPSVQTMETSI